MSEVPLYPNADGGACNTGLVLNRASRRDELESRRPPLLLGQACPSSGEYMQRVLEMKGTQFKNTWRIMKCGPQYIKDRTPIVFVCCLNLRITHRPRNVLGPTLTPPGNGVGVGVRAYL